MAGLVPAIHVLAGHANAMAFESNKKF